MSTAPVSTGKIVQIIGAVIDVQFPREHIPKVYEALKLEDVDLTLEVQQQLGDGVVRTIAMGVSEGLKRGLTVKATGGPISVPVGNATLGRIMDVLGAPQDEKGPVLAKEFLPIHRPAPSYEEQAGGRSCWSPVSRSSTCSFRSRRAARSVCSAVPASARPSTCSSSSTTSRNSTPACPCSPASASARARATTSITR